MFLEYTARRVAAAGCRAGVRGLARKDGSAKARETLSRADGQRQLKRPADQSRLDSVYGLAAPAFFCSRTAFFCAHKLASWDASGSLSRVSQAAMARS